jgi:hypothetical protein
VHDFGHRKERKVRKDSLNCLVLDYNIDTKSTYANDGDIIWNQRAAGWGISSIVTYLELIDGIEM